ncbi:MAG TPA: hypothetical protein VMT47_15705, partial [Polyangia bacterium]|nr:hypothetical protein [Polyangia bacterium]
MIAPAAASCWASASALASVGDSAGRDAPSDTSPADAEDRSKAASLFEELDEPPAASAPPET